MILSDYYDLPFNDIIDWKKFSVIVKERDVYQLKQILKDISDMEFIKLHKNLVQVHYGLSFQPGSYSLKISFFRLFKITYALTMFAHIYQVQKHFQWNSPPIKYDAFHMVMYDLWLRHHVIKY